jgi:hypothetical protein
MVAIFHFSFFFKKKHIQLKVLYNSTKSNFQNFDILHDISRIWQMLV